MADAESSVDVRVEDDGAGARWQSPDYFCGLLWSQVLTISFLVLHFLRPLVAAVVSITWIHDNQDRIGDTRVVFYRMFTGIGGIVFVLVTSVFYMWSLRGYDSKQIESRRVRGIVVNFLCSDLPLFGVECNIIINFGFDSTLLAISFGLTTISFFYSAMRVWVFAMERFIKHTDRPYLHGNRPLLDTSTSPNRYQPPSDHRGTAAPSFAGPREHGLSSPGQAGFNKPSPRSGRRGLPAFMTGNTDDALYQDRDMGGILPPEVLRKIGAES